MHNEIETLKDVIQRLNVIPKLVETKSDYVWTTFECGCNIIEAKNEKPKVNICDKHSTETFFEILKDSIVTLLKKPAVQILVIVVTAIAFCFAG